MEPRIKVLLVDDDPSVISSLQPFLERAGFHVGVAIDGMDALQKVESFEPDVVILDILMPRMDGRDVLRHLRQLGNWVHVIMLTQVEGSGERTTALNEGADDYVNKPFDPNELAARIHAVLRRARPGPASVILYCGPLKLDLQLHRVYLDKKEVVLSNKALRVLEYLMTHPGELISRETLLNAVWGWDYITGPRTVDVRIFELRKGLQDDAIQPRFIQTIPGVGYRFIGQLGGQP